VGCWLVGVTHLGSCWTGPSITQHSWPWVQHALPQQVSPFPQALPIESHGGTTHVPSSQVGLASGQTMPQPPQLKGSSYLSTHASPQQT
jgi:hypothetical protein